MQNFRKYTHAELVSMEGQEIKFRTSFEQVMVDRIYIYNVASVKVRGLRGASAFVDLFDVHGKNIATISVFMTDRLEVYDISCPCFNVVK